MVRYFKPKLHRSVPRVLCFSPGLWTTSELTDSSGRRPAAATSVPETAALKTKNTPKIGGFVVFVVGMSWVYQISY